MIYDFVWKSSSWNKSNTLHLHISHDTIDCCIFKTISPCDSNLIRGIFLHRQYKETTLKWKVMKKHYKAKTNEEEDTEKLKRK